MGRRIKVWALLLCMGTLLLLLGAAPTEAAVFKWSVSGIRLEHKKISFTVDWVEKAQGATVVVLDAQKQEILSKDFAISNKKENIVLDLQGEECLCADMENGSSRTEYYLYVKDEQGDIATDTSRAYLQHHTNFLASVTAYPNLMEIKNFWQEGIHVSATVNFQEFEGVQDEDGDIIIEYPHQEEGAYVQLKWWDDYGCYGTRDEEVENDSYVFVPSLEVFRCGAAIIYDKLYADRRLAVKIGDEVYYSSYGAGNDLNVVDYPEIPKDTTSVTVWVECKNGSKSREEVCDICECKLEECSYTLKVYPGKAFGTVLDNGYGQSPALVSATVGGRKYQAEVKNGSFTLEYPAQKRYILELVFTDQHGCAYTRLATVYDSLSSESTEDCVWKEDVLRKSASAEMPYKDMRLCVEVAGKIYYSRYSSKSDDMVKASYPQQKVGTAVKIWLEHKNTSLTEAATYRIYNKPIKFSAKAKTTGLTGKYFSDEKAKIEVIASGKVYNCKLVKKWDDEGDLYYGFFATYPKQKVNSYVKVQVTDENGYSRTQKFKLQNIPPKLTVSGVDSGSVKITGKTDARSKVTAQINGRKYKGKANKSGKFSFKIKQSKAGTKIKVSVVTPEGYTKSKTVKVRLANGSVDIPSYVYRMSSSISLKVKKGQKGDKVKVDVGGRTYTKTIKKTKKTQNVTVNINPAAAGTRITVKLCDKFGKVKDTCQDMVYVGDNIFVGMSAEEACLTTWGTPKRNNWGGIIQWVFQSGGTRLYVYIRDGRVASIQKLSY